MRGIANIPLVLSVILFSISLSGCSQLDRYSRTYNVGYDADTRTGTIGITLTPVAPVNQPVPPPAALSDETIVRIVKLIMDSKPVTPEAVKTIDFKQPVEALLK